MRRTAPLLGAAAAGGLLGGALMGAAEYVARQMTAPPPRRAPLRLGFTPFETGVDWEEIFFPGPGGVQLGGWLLPQEPAAPALLACGGYRGRRSDLLGISSSLWRAGFTVLLFDYGGYGDEPGPVTLGHHEAADARAAIRYLRGRLPGSPLGVIGFSMGASIAIMLGADEPAVRAVVADSPFTSQQEIVRHHMATGMGLRPSPVTEPVARAVLRLVDRRLARRFGFRLADVQPLRDVRRLGTRPLLLIHGESDRTIPVAHGRRMAAAARAAGVPVQTWFVPECGHCQAYFVDRTGYCEGVAAFFRRALLPGPAVRAEPAAVAAAGMSALPKR